MNPGTDFVFLVLHVFLLTVVLCCVVLCCVALQLTLLVINIFVLFAFYMLFIIGYGVMANSELIKHRVYLLESLSQLHQRFRVEHGPRASELGRWQPTTTSTFLCDLTCAVQMPMGLTIADTSALGSCWWTLWLACKKLMTKSSFCLLIWTRRSWRRSRRF